jgi:hypothetical protein
MFHQDSIGNFDGMGSMDGLKTKPDIEGEIGKLHRSFMRGIKLYIKPEGRKWHWAM